MSQHFQKFTELPSELQQMVWKEAEQEARSSGRRKPVGTEKEHLETQATTDLGNVYSGSREDLQHQRAGRAADQPSFDWTLDTARDVFGIPPVPPQPQPALFGHFDTYLGPLTNTQTAQQMCRTNPDLNTAKILRVHTQAFPTSDGTGAARDDFISSLHHLLLWASNDSTICPALTDIVFLPAVKAGRGEDTCELHRCSAIRRLIRWMKESRPELQCHWNPKDPALEADEETSWQPTTTSGGRYGSYSVPQRHSRADKSWSDILRFDVYRQYTQPLSDGTQASFLSRLLTFITNVIRKTARGVGQAVSSVVSLLSGQKGGPTGAA